MSIMKRLGAVALVIVLAGCSYVPMRTPEELTKFGEGEQKYWQSASHWRVLAHAIAGDVATAVGGGQRVYIERLDDNSPFGGAFRDSLITALHKVGVEVEHTRKKNAVRLHYNIRAIRHSDTDYMPPKGTLMAMAIGAATIYHLADEFSSNWPATIVAALLTEIFEIPAPEVFDGPMSEVQISYTLIKGKKTMARRTNIYYVDSQQIHQYAGALPAGPMVVRTEGYSSRPPSTRRISVRPEQY